MVIVEDRKGIQRRFKIRNDLVEAAENLIDRWHSPNWKNTEHTAMYIKALEAAVSRARGET